jgi:hypothetical protein
MHLVSRSKYQDNGKDKWVVRQLPVSLLGNSILYSRLEWAEGLAVQTSNCSPHLRLAGHKKG